MNKIGPTRYVPPPPSLRTEKPNTPAVASSGLEEATFGLSEKKDSSKKRESGSDSLRRDHLNNKINKIEQIQKYSEQLGEQDQISAKYQQIMSSVKDSGGLDRWIKGESESEEAVTWMALKKAANSAKDPEKGILQAKAFEFLKRHTTEIQTSFNVNHIVIKSYGKDQSKARKMRKAIAKGNKKLVNIRSILSILLDTFEDEDFPESFDVYTRSIAQDSKSDMPSTNLSYLSDIYARLNAANGARSILRDCEELLLKAERYITLQKGSAKDMAQAVLTLTEDEIFDVDIRDAIGHYANTSTKDQVTFLNLLYPLLNHLPEAIWSNDELKIEGIKVFLSYMEAETRKESEYSDFEKQMANNGF